MIGAGNVARAAGSGTHTGSGFDHGPNDLRMLCHAEVIIRAPNHDIALALRGMPNGVWEASCNALQVDENPVTALVTEFVECRREQSLVIHCTFPARRNHLLEGF